MQPEARTNRTAVTEFILLGLVETENLQPMVFALLPPCLLGHCRGQPQHPGSHLGGTQTPHPHVLFLGNLSVLDIGCITVIVPAMLSRPCPTSAQFLCSLPLQLFSSSTFWLGWTASCWQPWLQIDSGHLPTSPTALAWARRFRGY